MSEKISDNKITIDLSKAKSHFRAEGMTVINRNFHFLQDENFMKVYNNLTNDEKEKSRIWKVHIFCNFFKHGLNLNGDLIECGVFRGFSSAVACNLFNFDQFNNKKLFLFDTWDGIPEDQLDELRKKNTNINKQYKLKENLMIVDERFKKFNNVIKVKGKVPDSFKKINLPKKISFLHLDMNTHIGEIAALERLFQRLVKGAVCLLDDFGVLVAREQMLNEKKWFAERNYNVCELPTGQAFVIKL